MKKGILLMIIVLLTALLVNGCATTTSLTYLPTDTKIIPSKDTTDGKYVGIWIGSWFFSSNNRILNTTLVIEKITQKKVTAIYSWGSGTEDWARINGIMENGIIILEFKSNVIIITQKNDDALSVEFRKTGQTSTTIYRRYVPLPKK